MCGKESQISCNLKELGCFLLISFLLYLDCEEEISERECALVCAGGDMYNILICDDEKDIVNALKIYLSDENYHFGRLTMEQKR